MTEETTHNWKPGMGKIPEETRQHMRAAREELRKSMAGFFPPEFIEHHRRARKEMLLAWRSMIDAALEKAEK